MKKNVIKSKIKKDVIDPKLLALRGSKELKSLGLKRHETILDDDVFERYEAFCSANKISARAMTAMIIELRISEDGNIRMGEWRNGRLIKLINECEKLSTGITEHFKFINDHKGLLTVDWCVRPSIHDMSIVSQAWQAVGENPDESFHYFQNDEAIQEWEDYKNKKNSDAWLKTQSDDAFAKRLSTEAIIN